MKCPYTGMDCPCPTQRQFLAWFYRYVYEYSEKDTARIMGIEPRNVRGLLQRMKKIWPNLFSIPRKDKPSLVQFNENLHSEPKEHF